MEARTADTRTLTVSSNNRDIAQDMQLHAQHSPAKRTRIRLISAKRLMPPMTDKPIRLGQIEYSTQYAEGLVDLGRLVREFSHQPRKSGCFESCNFSQPTVSGASHFGAGVSLKQKNRR